MFSPFGGGAKRRRGQKSGVRKESKKETRRERDVQVLGTTVGNPGISSGRHASIIRKK